MNEALLALVSAVVLGVGGWLGLAGKAFINRVLVPVVKDSLSTNKALRGTLSRMGQRVRRLEGHAVVSGDMLAALHRQQFGEKRTSSFDNIRAELRAERAEVEPEPDDENGGEAV